jgi:hypothetical protein
MAASTSRGSKTPASKPATPPAPAGPRAYFRRGQAAGHAAARQTRRAAGGTWRAAARVTTRRRRYTARHVLTAELLAGVGIVAIRAVADYEPQADGTLKGKIGHPSGQYGPLPILAGLIMAFFLLSFLAAQGGTRAKVAAITGGLLVVVLGMKSSREFAIVAGTFGTFGKAKKPAGNWQTTGTAAGQPVLSGSGAGSSAGGGSSGGSGKTAPDYSTSNPPGPDKKGRCPPGWKKNAAGLCGPKPPCPSGWMPDGAGGCVQIPMS